MHTQSSRIYREHRIRSHDQQIRASMLVMLHLRKHYGTLADRHDLRIRTALANVERRIRASLL